MSKFNTFRFQRYGVRKFELVAKTQFLFWRSSLEPVKISRYIKSSQWEEVSHISVRQILFEFLLVKYNHKIIFNSAVQGFSLKAGGVVIYKCPPPNHSETAYFKIYILKYYFVILQYIIFIYDSKLRPIVSKIKDRKDAQILKLQITEYLRKRSQKIGIGLKCMFTAQLFKASSLKKILDR